ncbi:MAG: hydantoinase B/oxoprolinase family protein, partial [Burkholderiales bacterium]|nr:hydantoinase B/oxoprolinase family protein [Anaerolineae bacterium]
PANDGCFRPLEVVCPDGLVITAKRPAPVSTYWETMEFAADLVWKALAPIVPQHLTAGHFLSVCGTVVSGVHPDTGDLFILVEPQAGGWGAGIDRDGQNGLVCIGDGETYVVPVEVAETRYGVIVDQFSLSIADGGAGRYRGGRGLIRDYRITSEEALVTGTFGRFKFLPWGMKGGQIGSPNYMEMIHADGTSKIFGKTARYKLKRGEVARLVTGTGGGYGDPNQRPDDEIARDVRDGYLTPEMAERDYGVTVDGRGNVSRTRRTPGRASAVNTASTQRDDVHPDDKREAVLSVLRGQTTASTAAAKLNVGRDDVERWMDQFLNAGAGALGGSAGRNGDGELRELRAIVRDLADEVSSLRRSLRDGR